MGNKNKFMILVMALAIYNVAYGGLCYYLMGVPGVILGMNFMLLVGIIGLIIISHKNRNR